MVDVKAVCDAVPSGYANFAPTHSALAGLVGGFSLTCAVVVFSLGRRSRAGFDSRIDGPENATVALLAASVAALYASYLYSAETSTFCLTAAYEMVVPGLSLTVAAMLLVAGIGAITSSTMGAERPTMFEWALRSYRALLVAIFCLFGQRAWIDAQYASALSIELSSFGVSSWEDAASALEEFASRSAPPLDEQRLAEELYRRATDQIDSGIGAQLLFVLAIPVLAFALACLEHFLSERRDSHWIGKGLTRARSSLPVLVVPGTLLLVILSTMVLSRSPLGDTVEPIATGWVFPLTVFVTVIPSLTMFGYWRPIGSVPEAGSLSEQGLEQESQ